jgi:hypothetical protein
MSNFFFRSLTQEEEQEEEPEGFRQIEPTTNASVGFADIVCRKLILFA